MEVGLVFVFATGEEGGFFRFKGRWVFELARVVFRFVVDVFAREAGVEEEVFFLPELQGFLRVGGYGVESGG